MWHVWDWACSRHLKHHGGLAWRSPERSRRWGSKQQERKAQESDRGQHRQWSVKGERAQAKLPSFQMPLHLRARPSARSGQVASLLVLKYYTKL